MQVKVANLRSPEFSQDLIKSVTNTGFVVVTHHGIDFGLIKEAQYAWREFFTDDQAYKNSFINPHNDNMGYRGMRSEQAVGAAKPDLKEFFHWKPSYEIPRIAKNPTTKMFHQLEDVGLQILSVLGTGYKESCENSENTLFRTLYYPAMDFSSDPTAVRAAAHEDINHITLLVAASAPGLQVKDNQGNWHDVPHEDNSIVVNIADMLQLASGGLYKSTTHRVVNPENTNTDRISMPLFIHPKGETLLAQGITAKQFLDQRLEQIYGKVK